MAISEVGTRSVAIVTAADGAQFTNNISHTSTSDTDILVAFLGMEGAEAITSCDYDDVAMTLIHDTGTTGSNSDVRIYVYGMVSPGAKTANGKTRYSGGGANPGVSVWVNFKNTNTDSVAAATSAVSDDINTIAGTTGTLASGGAAGNALIAFGVGQGNDMAPSSLTGGFTEMLDAVTSATVTDFAYLLASNYDTAPTGSTITWSTSDQNGQVLIELIAATGGVVPQAMHHYRNQGKVF